MNTNKIRRKFIINSIMKVLMFILKLKHDIFFCHAMGILT